MEFSRTSDSELAAQTRPMILTSKQGAGGLVRPSQVVAEALLGRLINTATKCSWTDQRPARQRGSSNLAGQCGLHG